MDVEIVMDELLDGSKKSSQASFKSKHVGKDVGWLDSSTDLIDDTSEAG